MSTLPEQFSAASSKHLEAQFQLFQQFTSQAVTVSARIASLNIQTARASLEQSTHAMAQVMAARDPRDLLSLTTQSQISFDSMLGYGRALFGIASGATAAAAGVKAAPAAAQVAPQVAARVAAQAPMLVVEQPDAAAVPAEVATLPTPQQASPAKAKPLARAVARTTPKAKSARPAAAPLPDAAGKPVKVTSLKAVQASPPPAESPQLDMLATRSKKKK